MPTSSFTLNAILGGGGIRHAKISGIDDGVDTAKVRPSDWHANHVMSIIGCRVTRSTSQTGIVTATFTPVTFDTENYDTNGFHSTTSNTSRMTIPTGLGGKYLIIGQVEWDSNTTGERILEIGLNGASGGGSIAWSRDNIVNANGLTRQVSSVYALAAGNYIEMFVYQTSGANRSIGAAASRCWLSITYLGA